MAKRAADITPIRAGADRKHQRPQKIKTLTSSGQLVGRPGDPQVPPPGHATHLWQYDALSYSDSVPELKAAMMWYGNCGSRIRLVPGLYDDYGAVQTSFDDSDVEPPPELDEAAEYIYELRDRLGGQSEITRAGFENFFCTGEAYLVGYEGVAGNDWEMLSINELRAMGSGSKTLGQKFARMWGPGLPLEELPEGTFIGRLWWPHRRFKRLADSSVHGCLEVLESLVLLTHGVRASQVSRLRGAGILFVPTGSIAGYGEGGEEGSEEDDPWLRDFMEAMVNPIEDPASSSRVAPLVTEMDGDDIAKVKFLSFGEMDRAESVVERREAIERLGMGLNIPPSRILGHSESTFDNAATITEDEFRTYLEPTAILLCAGLTNTYLAERFRAAHRIAPDAPLPPPYDRIAVGYDASKLIAKPDRSKEIMQALQVAPWIVSGAAARRAIGIEEADAPDDTEILETLHRHQQLNTRGTIRIAETDPTLSVAVDRVLLADPDGDLDEAALKVDEQQAAPTPPAPVVVPAAPAPPSPGDGEPPVTASAMPASSLFAVRASAAAELAVTLAVEAAGRRLRGKARGASKSALDGVPNDRVALTLGPAAVAKLCGDEEPFNGELAALGSMLARLAADAGLSGAAQVAGHVVGLVEAAAQARLFDPSAVLSATMVEEALRG